jgi:hypothetical protein
MGSASNRSTSGVSHIAIDSPVKGARYFSKLRKPREHHTIHKCFAECLQHTDELTGSSHMLNRKGSWSRIEFLMSCKERTSVSEMFFGWLVLRGNSNHVFCELILCNLGLGDGCLVYQKTSALLQRVHTDRAAGVLLDVAFSMTSRSEKLQQRSVHNSEWTYQNFYYLSPPVASFHGIR